MRIIERPTLVEKTVVTQDKKGSLVLFMLKKANRLLFITVAMVVCLFPLIGTNAQFYSEAVIEGTEFSTGCWVPPTAPLLVSLADDEVINQGNAWLSNPLMDWDASDTTCPTGQLEYQFRVASDVDFNSVVETSPWLSATEFVTSATQSGEYYWQVMVRDANFDTVPEATSSTRHYTVQENVLQPPTNLGWNLPTQSTTPNEMPLDLVCDAVTDGGNPAAPTVAHNWTAVAGTNIKYQREVTYPNGSTISFFYETNNHTQFAAFGSFPGIQGLWKTRVRAYQDMNGNNQIDTGELTSAFSNYCNITLDENPPAPQEPQIVLNEILPDPIGLDNAALPGGEWVELYNKSNGPIDVAGWKITASPGDNYPLFISDANAFNSVAVGPGTTIVPANGFLVVYRAGSVNFNIDNDGDTVKLFNASNVVQDQVTYLTVEENKSIVRFPDGADNWVDPSPTPGRANVVDNVNLDPSVLLFQQDSEHALIALLDAINYDNAKFVVTYTRDEAGNDVPEGFEKDVAITANTQFLFNLFLGSTSGEEPNINKYPHNGVKDVHVEVTLEDDVLTDLIIEADMYPEWSNTP